MKQCVHCKQAIPDTANFCYNCGRSTSVVNNQNPMGTCTLEQIALDKLSSGLKWEVVCYRVVGIISLVLAILTVLLGCVFGVAGVAIVADDSYVYSEEFGDGLIYGDEGYYNDNFGGAVYDTAETVVGVSGVIAGVAVVFSGLIGIAAAVVNLVAASRVSKYKDMLYINCTEACRHATSAGVIVFAVFFNLIALIPIIINYVHVDGKRSTFELIKANQISGSKTTN